jgi:hypothetical protein
LPIQVVKAYTSTRDLLSWILYLDKLEIEEFEKDLRTVTKLDWYLAQLAAEVFRTIAKYPENVKIKDFFIPLRLKENKSKKKVTIISPEEKEKRHKAVWNVITNKDKINKKVRGR